MKVYKVSRFNSDITEINATRVNEKSIWSIGYSGKEERCARNGYYVNYLDSYSDAKQWLLDFVSGEISKAEKKLSKLIGELSKINNL